MLEQQLKAQLDYVEQQIADMGHAEDNAPQTSKRKAAGRRQRQTVPAPASVDRRRKQLTSKLEFLKNQLNIEGLENEFVPRDQTLLGPSSPGPISPNILQYNQLLNQIK